MRLLALDPGGTTGVAVYLPMGEWHWEVAAWSMAPDEAVDLVWVLLASGFDAVATEAFSIRSGTPVSRHTATAPEVNGAVRFIARHLGAVYTEVSPVDRAGAVKKIRAHGTGWAGTGDHAHDAQAVGLVATGAAPDSVVVQTGGMAAVGWGRIARGRPR